MLTDSATLKLDNHNNGRKGVCVQQHANGKKSCAEFVPLGVATVTSLRLKAEIWKIWLSEYWDDRKNCCEITDEDILQNVNFAAT